MIEIVIQTTGWTLIHFLWQGLAIGATYGIFMAAFRTSPKIRYCVGLVALLLMLGATAKTFHTQWTTAQVTAQRKVQTNQATVTYQHTQLTFSDCLSCHTIVKATPIDPPPTVPPIEPQPSESTSSIFFWISGIWLTGVGFFILRLGISHLLIQRLRRHHSNTPDSSLEQKIKRLSDQLGMKSKVGISISDSIQIPTVIGWLRPLILVPRVSIAELSKIQLDSILTHELAHIKRRDYLVNLLQHVIESIFFFHPAVWFVSSSIRKEREFCCDDIAAGTTRNVTEYARALTTLEELRNHHPALGMAANGGSLLNRIRRLGGYHTPRSYSLLIGSACILIAAICIPFTVLPTCASAETDTPADEFVKTLPLPSRQAADGLRHLLGKEKQDHIRYQDFAELAKPLNDSDLNSLIQEVRSLNGSAYKAWTLQALMAEQSHRASAGHHFQLSFQTCCATSSPIPNPSQ